MIPAYAALFTGELAVYGDRFVLTDDVAPESAGRDLVEAERLSLLLSRFGSARYPGADRRAVTSLWSKYHFAALLPPFLAISLIAEREIDLSLDAIGCSFSADGATQTIHLADAGRPASPGDAFARFMPLIDTHLSPLIGALATVGGVSRKVLWSNAGNLFEFVVRRIEQAARATGPVADATTLMAARRLPDGRPNALFDPVRYLPDPGGPRRVRRVCCLRYFAPDLDYCSTCPLPEARP